MSETNEPPHGAQTGTRSLDGHGLRRALAVAAVDAAVHASGAWLPLSVRQAVADAVLAAIDPALEHCIHHVDIHHRHHRSPIDGCPWCAAGTRVDEIETGGPT